MLDKAIIEELLEIPIAWFFENSGDLCPPITVEDAILKTVALEPKKSKYDTMRCPCCEELVNKWHRYCPDCGQRLDWKHIKSGRRDGDGVN